MQYVVYKPVFLKSWVHGSMQAGQLQLFYCLFLPSSACMSVCSHENGGKHCVWHSGQMLKPCRSMYSLFPLMCWKQRLFYFIYFFFQWEKMAVKADSEVHRYGNDLQICLLHFSTDCAGKMPLGLPKNHSSLLKRRRRGRRKALIWNVWEHPKVFAWMPLWSENLYDVGTIRTNEHRDVAALCRHLKSPLLLFCFIIFLCATTVNDWCRLCKWARGKKHG